ncbi:hypothetical protein PMAYCL1PPCAC_19530, partial [Pristionchus mayeri]
QAVYDDFLGCKTNADQASTAILNLLPTFYPNPGQRERNLNALAAMLVVIDAMQEARECKPLDSVKVQTTRKQYRTELWAFLEEIKILPQLKAVYDDFLGCRTNADQTSTAILNLLPTFYPNPSQRERNLNALAAMLVVIDAMQEARE